VMDDRRAEEAAVVADGLEKRVRFLMGGEELEVEGMVFWGVLRFLGTDAMMISVEMASRR